MVLPSTKWFDGVGGADDIISECRPLPIFLFLIFIISLNHFFHMIICQFISVFIKEKHTNTNKMAHVCYMMLPPPTKLFSTRSVDALASAAAGALRAAFGGADFADAFFLLLPLVVVVELDCFPIVVGDI